MPKEDKQKETEGGRAFWSGTISFGLVTVPINLFPANRSGGVHWRMLDEDGTPLKRRFYCPEEDREVSREELIRGYEYEDGKYVTITDKELESLAPRKSRDIDLRAFVDADEISPLFFERSYFLTPGAESNKAYRLLATLMEEKNVAGIATFVMRDKEYLVAILSENGILRAETLRFKDEVRSPGDVGLHPPTHVDKSRLEHVLKQIEKIKEEKVKPSLLENEYAERVQKLLEKKRKEDKDLVKLKPVEAEGAEEEDEDGEVDLMAMLKRSLAGGAGQVKGTTKPAAKKKAASKKTTASKGKPRGSGSPRTRRKTA